MYFFGDFCFYDVLKFNFLIEAPCQQQSSTVSPIPASISSTILINSPGGCSTCNVYTNTCITPDNKNWMHDNFLNAYYIGNIWNGTVQSCCSICAMDDACAFFINYGDQFNPPACFTYTNVAPVLAKNQCDTETLQGTIDKSC
jgi:hypothetical protein